MKASKIFSRLIKTASASFLIAALVGAASCTKTPDPIPTPEPLPATYTIKGQVYNNSTKAVLPGVTVTMGTKTATTDSFGKFEFANLTTAGKYNIVLTKADFFPATYSIEFPVAAPNHSLVFNLTMTLQPAIPGSTLFDPMIGGTLFIEGGDYDATLVIPAGTTVKDANNATVSGVIGFTGVKVNDIIVNGQVHNPAIMAILFGPSGYVFNQPLVLSIDNPLTAYRFSEVQLEYFNSTLNKWEVQTTPVTYNAERNDYVTTLTHFSPYKISLKSQLIDLAATNRKIKVLDSLMINRGLTDYNVTAMRYEANTGYKFVTPLATLLATAGITQDQPQLIKAITNLVTINYNGIAPVDNFGTTTTTISVERTIQSMFYLITTGNQEFKSKKFTIKLINLSNDAEVVLEVITEESGIVTLSYEDLVYDNHAHSHLHGHDHGLGGGGTI